MGGMKTMLDDAFDYANKVMEKRLAKKGPKSGKSMKGLHCYDLLANPRIAPSLAYVSADNKNRNELIMDDDEDENNDQAQSDLVRAVVGLAYMKDIEGFKFDTDYMMSLAQKKDSIQ